MKKCFIHAGLGKTGTSLIQGYCQRNFDHLKKNDIFYPNLHNPKSQPKAINHSGFCAEGASFEKLGDYIRNNDAIKSVILSAEAPHNRAWRDNTYEFCRINELDPKVIIYLRRQDMWLESAWKQWGVKSKDDSSITEFIDSHLAGTDWLEVLELWAEKFGRENLMIRIYEKQNLHNQDLIDDFFHVIDPTYRQVPTPPDIDYGSRNTGFKAPVLELLANSKSLCSGLHDNTLFHLYDRYLSDIWKKQPFDSYGLLSPLQRKEILARHEASNQEVARTYLGRSDGKLFANVEESESEEMANQLDIPAMSLIMTDILMNVDRQLRQLNRKSTVINRPLAKIRGWGASLRRNIKRKFT